MNPFPSSLEEAQTQAPSFNPPQGNDSEVVTLSCPACRNELKLRRKHFGVKGNCVHCQIPVKAVKNRDGHIIIENLSEMQPGLPVDEASDSPSESTLPVHRTPPPFLSEPEPVSVTQSEIQEETTLSSPPVFPEEEVTFSGKPEQTGTPPLISQEEPSGRKIDSAVEGSSAPLFGGDLEKTSLFGNTATPPTLEPDISSETKSIRDDPKPPEAGNGGFAETLFSGKPTGLSSDSQPQTEEASTQKTKNSAIGHPLQQATAKKLKPSSSSNGLPPFVKLLRNLVIIAVLVLAGYVGFSMAPPEKVKGAKAQIKEWLKPGAVLLEDLPFNIPGLSEDKPDAAKPVVIQKPKAPEKLKPPVKPKPDPEPAQREQPE